MSETNSGKQHSWISEAIWVALLPAAGFWMAYLYKSAALSFYGVPSELVSVDITDILKAVGGIAGASLLYLNPLISVSGEPTSYPFRNLEIVNTVILSTVAFGLIYGLMPWPFAIVVVVVLAMIDGMEVGFPYFRRHEFGGFQPSLEAYRNRMLHGNPGSYIRSFERRVGSQIFYAVVILFVLTIGSFLAGRFVAGTRMTYTILPGTPSKVVVGEFKDSYIVTDKTMLETERYPTFELVLIVNSGKVTQQHADRIRRPD